MNFQTTLFMSPIFIFSLVWASEPALAACVVDGKNTKVTESSRKECLSTSRMMHNSDGIETLTAEQLRTNKQELPFGLPIKPEDSVHCRILLREKTDPWGGDSDKFFCVMTDANGDYYDTNYKLVSEAKSHNADEELMDGPFVSKNGKVIPTGNVIKIDGKKAKGIRLKVKYSKGNKSEVPVRQREQFTEAAGSRILWALGLNADAVYAPAKVVCEGCERDPKGVRQTSILMDRSGNFAKTEFFPISVEYRYPGKTIEVKDEQGWKTSELESGFERWDFNRKIDYITLVAFLNLANHHNVDGISGAQNRIACPRNAISKDTDVCSDPVVVMDDLGSSLGGNKELDGNGKLVRARANYRGKFSSYNLHTFFKKGCTFSIGTSKVSGIDETGRLALLERMKNLTPENVYAIFKGARFDYADYDQLKELRKQAPKEIRSDKAAVEAWAHEAALNQWVAKFNSLVKEVENAKCR